jgi:hypothetical protein
MHSAHLRIVNERGLHARAAAKFVALAGSFDAEVRVTHHDTTVPGVSTSTRTHLRPVSSTITPIFTPIWFSGSFFLPVILSHSATYCKLPNCSKLSPTSPICTRADRSLLRVKC